MRLVAFGCSETYGNGLDDCWIGIEKQSPNPSKYAWPQVLADKLGIECVNKGFGGSSNKQILNIILNFDFKPDDIVFIRWTYFARTCIVKENDIERLNAYMTKQKAVNYYKHLYDDYDHFIDFCLRSQYGNMYLEQKNIKVYNLPISDMFDYEFPKWYNVKFLKSRLSKYRNKFPLGVDGVHPGILAQEAYTNDIYNEIIKDLNG